MIAEIAAPLFTAPETGPAAAPEFGSSGGRDFMIAPLAEPGPSLRPQGTWSV